MFHKILQDELNVVLHQRLGLWVIIHLDGVWSAWQMVTLPDKAVMEVHPF